MVASVHAPGYAKMGLQLGHGGRKGSTRLAWDGMDEPLPQDNWQIIAASPIPYFPHSQVPRAMDRQDMDAGPADFVRAARMAGQAGLANPQIPLPHGHFLASFLPP